MDDIFSLDSLYADEDVPEELYKLVRNGLCSQLDARLCELPNSVGYLTALSWHDQEQLSLLMVAALNGYDEIIRVLLTHCNSIDQVELKGQIIISDEKRIDGATALYCACYRGHFTIAKTLIEFGKANINQDTSDYLSYPLLIHATIMNRLDIVRFLVENRYSDVNETKSDDCSECTALIWAAFRGHTSIVEYLIKTGADVNYSCGGDFLENRTPLALAASAGQLESIRLLYDANANVNGENESDDTLLTIAVRHNHKLIVDFLLERSMNTIEDLELVICSLVDVSLPTRQMNMVFELLTFALQYRQSTSQQKTCLEPIAAYHYEQECQTMDELNAIENNPLRILIETLLIRERIFLSRKDITIIKPLHNYGDWLVSKREFDDCLNVWIHMFYLYQQMEFSTVLHRFVWLFCKMLRANHIIPVKRFIQVCQLIFEPSQMIERKCTIHNALFFVIIATKILAQEGISQEEQTSIYRWITELCRYQLTTTNGRTLLHLCVDFRINRKLTFRSMDTSPYLRFPDKSALQLLMACGSRWLDFDAIESAYGNTPLHIVSQKTKDQYIIKLLLDAGCHIDCVNKDGKTPLDYVEDKETRALFITASTPLNLKCLCARIIVNKHLNVSILGPSTSRLNKFVGLHGGLFIQSAKK